jgi:lysophospholipase L1-like esterase
MSTLIGLVFLEFGLRIGMGNFAQSELLRRSDDAEVCLENEPGTDIQYTGWAWRVAPTRMRVNSVGARGPEFTNERRPGVARIVAVGDSFTFGQGVAEDEAWVQVAGSRLHTWGHRNEVLNFGVPGHGTPQSVALVEKRLLPLQPDLVLVGVFANDLTPEDSYCLYGRGGNTGTRFLLRHVYTGRLLYMLGQGRRQARDPALAAKYGTPEDRFVRAMNHLSDLGRQRGFLATAVLLTDREMYTDGQSCPGCTPSHDLVGRTGVYVMDMTPVWRLLHSDIPRFFIPGEDHLSTDGNRVMGEALADALRNWPEFVARAPQSRR